MAQSIPRPAYRSHLSEPDLAPHAGRGARLAPAGVTPSCTISSMDTGELRDAFGNEIDPIVGYARGRILSTDAAFHAKIRYAHTLIRARAADGGAFHVLTGNRADFPLGAADLGPGCDGWVGPAIYGPALA